MTQRFLLTTVFHNHKISTDSIHEILKGKATLVNWLVEELKDDDFIVEDIEPNVTKKRIRGPLNLRRHNENKLREGDLCIVDGLEHSPRMLIEHIAETEDPTNKVIKIPTAQCCWFVNNQLNRAPFKVENLKKYVKEEPIKKVSNIQDVNLYGYSMTDIVKKRPNIINMINSGEKIKAISEIRSITGLGLKETKDMVEAVTPIMLANWQQGVFE